MKNFFFLAVLALLFSGCKNETTGGKTPPVNPNTVSNVEAPAFDANRAYAFIEKQLAFGPRVPETPAHDSCAAWLSEQFTTFGTKVFVQKAEVYGFKGKSYNIKNIVASTNPDASKRILLCAHWDTRAVADQDTERKDEPIPGADDGGSGVAVLLEVAKVLHNNPLKNIGVDIVLFDAEDQGGSNAGYVRESWCLGAQYWSKQPHTENYKAEFGILLDMVGSSGARFAKEGVSLKHASFYVDKVWRTAWSLQFSDFFVDDEERQLVDDHVFVNEILKIPTIDIINLPASSPTGFGAYWHTHKDNIDIISKTTLKAVGQTLIQVLFNEDAAHAPK